MPHDLSPRICITLDLDWAPDDVVEPVLDAIRAAGAKCTVFATHASPLLMSLDDDGIEVGLHPNFNDCAGDFEPRVRDLKYIYPRAVGARSHSLFVSSHILQLYRKYDLTYEANIFLGMHQYLHPVMRFPNFVSIPFYWSDDRLEVSGDSDLASLQLDTPGLKVLNFHPLHVFMNTYSEKHYLSYKPHCQDPAKLRMLVNRERPGVWTLFDALLSQVHEAGTVTYTMREIYNRFIEDGY